MVATIRQLPFVALMLPALASATITFNSTLVFSAAATSSDNFTYSGVIDPKILSISTTCADAYAQDIPCDKWLIQSFDHNGDSYTESDIYNNATLNTLCTNECIAGLDTWRDDIRSSCSSKDVANANAAAQNYGDIAGNFIASVANTTQKLVEYLYYPMCLRDLKTGAFCALEIYDDLSSNFDNSADGADTVNATYVAEICDNTCITQTATFYSTVYASVVGTEDITIKNISTVCPNLDTSTFPFLQNSTNSSSSSSNSAGSSSSSSSSSSSHNSTNGTSSSGSVAHGNGADVVAAGSFWIMAGAFAVAFGML